MELKCLTCGRVVVKVWGNAKMAEGFIATDFCIQKDGITFPGHLTY